MAEDPVYDLDFAVSTELLKAGDSRGVNCPKCAQNTEFICRNYFKTTPKYLLLIPNRFYIEGGSHKKLNAIIKMP